VIGIGEDGLAGLPREATEALRNADIVFGGARHLELAGIGARGRTWPVPFTLAPVLTERGKRVAVLVSGDPFWFGAGSLIAQALPREEWLAFPAPSTFSLAAARLGWALEDTPCHALHASPFETILLDLTHGARLIALMRDGAAPAALAEWLKTRGFGASRLHVLECLGGNRERIRIATADNFTLADIVAPVAVAIEAQGGPALARTPGLPDSLFAHDGQITKAAARALTLAALGPRQGEILWDLGAGSGSISVEWCLAGGGSAVAVERRADRAANITENARRFGLVKRIALVEGDAPHCLRELEPPHAVFIGGGANDALLDVLWSRLPAGTRLVANAVTLETESLLMRWSEAKGGSLLRIELAEAAPLGSMRGWQPARPLVQWSVTR